MAIIEAENLRKSYGHIEALKGVSLKVERGSIFALLGPNGAGKTTFIKVLLGLVKADAGFVKVAGSKAPQVESRKGVAYLPEKFNFYPYYTVSSALEFFAKMRGTGGQESKQVVERALQAVKMQDLKDRKVGQLSKGQVQRLGLAGLLTSEASVLIVDEPFSGLDPIGIKDFKDLIFQLKEQGKTIFINSHILSEMQSLSDHIAILNKGVCLASGSVKEITGNAGLEEYFYKTVEGASE